MPPIPLAISSRSAATESSYSSVVSQLSTKQGTKILSCIIYPRKEKYFQKQAVWDTPVAAGRSLSLVGKGGQYILDLHFPSISDEQSMHADRQTQALPFLRDSPRLEIPHGLVFRGIAMTVAPPSTTNESSFASHQPDTAGITHSLSVLCSLYEIRTALPCGTDCIMNGIQEHYLPPLSLFPRLGTV